QRAIDFAATNPDTLIIVTSDHETGGITAGQNNGAGMWPGTQSGDTRHNATWVPTYASGPNAGHFRGLIDNTDVPRLAVTAAIAPSLPITVRSFQQGLNGYAGTTDTQLQAATPDQTFGAAILLNADADEDPDNTFPNAAPVQLAIRFDDLFGAGSIPAEATIVNAKLSFFTGSESSDGTTGRLAIHRLLTDFDDTTTWNTAGNVSGTGFSLNAAGTDADYLAAAEYVFPSPTGNAVADFDVTASIAAWLAAHRDGIDTNFGWVILNNATNGWALNSSEAQQLARPTLEVSYTVPEPSAIASLALLLTAGLRRGR
ncbi:MAG TPA: DNRLRE domain-containing protein, partial [Tepidisphaeraceae bacterium]|nr:DNRLRE domain-containing protein [Tepidisphaeraceae bacterium]